MSLGNSEHIKELFEAGLNTTKVEYKDAYWKKFEKEFLQRKKVNPVLLTGIFILTVTFSVGGYFLWKKSQIPTVQNPDSQIETPNLQPIVLSDTLEKQDTLQITKESTETDENVDQVESNKKEITTSQESKLTKTTVKRKPKSKQSYSAKTRTPNKQTVEKAESNAKRQNVESKPKKKKYRSTAPRYRSRVYSNSSVNTKKKEEDKKKSDTTDVNPADTVSVK